MQSREQRELNWDKYFLWLDMDTQQTWALTFLSTGTVLQSARTCQQHHSQHVHTSALWKYFNQADSVCAALKTCRSAQIISAGTGNRLGGAEGGCWSDRSYISGEQLSGGHHAYSLFSSVRTIENTSADRHLSQLPFKIAGKCLWRLQPFTGFIIFHLQFAEKLRCWCCIVFSGKWFHVHHFEDELRH